VANTNLLLREPDNNRNFMHNSALSKVLLQELVAPQLVNKFPAFYVPEGSLLCSQQLATYPYPDPEEFSLHPCSLLL
jgi:hypothetical protein